MDWLASLKVTFILIIITIIFVCYRLLVHQVPTASLYDISDINLETGDVLLVSYNSLHATLVKVFAGSYWSHSAFVYRKHNRTYVIEMANYTNSKEQIPTKEEHKGLIMIPFEYWIIYNKKRYIGHLRCKSRKPSETKIQQWFDKMKTIVKGTNMDVLYWMNTLLSRKYKYEDKEEYFCTELVAKLLQDMNIIAKDYLPCCYSPNTLVALRNFEKVKIIKPSLYPFHNERNNSALS